MRTQSHHPRPWRQRAANECATPRDCYAPACRVCGGRLLVAERYNYTVRYRCSDCGTHHVEGIEC